MKIEDKYEEDEDRRQKDESNSAEPVWQSFNHLVDTWLPGAKLGYDFRMKKKQLLTSWKSLENPDVGLFSLEFNPTAKEFIGKWNGSNQYWRSGAWNGHLFNLAPDLSGYESCMMHMMPATR
nr:G-type lectin S-receptor-like serine/threonine-protein kinase At2g19130 [Tanacetum cinerariifolium]